MKFEIDKLTSDEWLLLQCMRATEIQARSDFPYNEGREWKYFEISRFGFITGQRIDRQLRQEKEPFNHEKALNEFEDLCSSLASKKFYIKTPEMKLEGHLFYDIYLTETDNDAFVDFLIKDEFIYQFIFQVMKKELALQEAFLQKEEEEC